MNDLATLCNQSGNNLAQSSCHLARPFKVLTHTHTHNTQQDRKEEDEEEEGVAETERAEEVDEEDGMANMRVWYSWFKLWGVGEPVEL